MLHETLVLLLKLLVVRLQLPDLIFHLVPQHGVLQYMVVSQNSIVYYYNNNKYKSTSWIMYLAFFFIYSSILLSFYLKLLSVKTDFCNVQSIIDFGITTYNLKMFALEKFSIFSCLVALSFSPRSF